MSARRAPAKVNASILLAHSSKNHSSELNTLRFLDGACLRLVGSEPHDGRFSTAGVVHGPAMRSPSEVVDAYYIGIAQTVGVNSAGRNS